MSKTIPFHNALKGEADCEQCSIRKTVLFAELTPDDFEKFHLPIHQFEFKRGQSIYSEGDNADAMFTIRSGLVKLVQRSADGKERIIRLSYPTNTMGLEALVESHYRHDAIALEDTSVCKLPVEIIQKLEHDNPAFRKALLSRWNNTLKDAEDWLAKLATGTARQRMARFILSLCQNKSEPLCRLPGREDIGSILSITTETASRIVADMKRQEILQPLDNGKLRADTGELEKIAE